MHIYFILTGENQHHSRSKRLLQIYDNKSKILISGLSSFKLKPKKSEAQIVKEFLIKNGIKKSNMILEEKSMDTIGNMVYSYKIIKKIKPTQITLITDDFHMKRSKYLYNTICGELSIETKFVKAHHHFKKIHSKILKLLIKTNIIQIQHHEDKPHLIDWIKYEVTKTEFHRHKINDYKSAYEFIKHFPVYNKRYKTKIHKNILADIIYRQLKKTN